MSETIETIEDIVNYLRKSCEVVDGSGAVLDGGELADRIEAAARSATMLCHQACSCELLQEYEARLDSEKERSAVASRAPEAALRNPDINRCMVRGCSTCYKDEDTCPTKPLVDVVAEAKGGDALTKYIGPEVAAEYVDGSEWGREHGESAVSIGPDSVSVAGRDVTERMSAEEFVRRFGDERMIPESARIVDYLEGLFDVIDYRIMVKARRQ